MRPIPLYRLLLPYVAFLIAAIALAIAGASSTAEARGVRGGAHTSVHAGVDAGRDMRLPLLIAAAALAAACSRQAPDKAEAPATQQAQEPAVVTPAVDPAAMAALDRMGAYLRTLQAFEVRAHTSLDEIDADTGQKLQFEGNNIYRVRRPNAFFIEANTDRRHRQFFYDGFTFTIYAPRMRLYAQAPAPGTIAETVALAEDRYDIHLPLKDLFYWGTPQVDNSNIVSAQHIGFARIDGADTDHAFRQGAVDWQIWIERGERPLPRKLVITSREQEGQPQFTSALTWHVSPRFGNSTFAFSPPAQARQIRFAGAEQLTP